MNLDMKKKYQKKKIIEALIESQKWSFEKFVTRNKKKI